MSRIQTIAAFFTLTGGDMVEYLSQFDDGDVVGEAGNPFQCPVARMLCDSDVTQVVVMRDYSTIAGQRIMHDEYIAGLIDYIDDMQQCAPVTAGECRRIIGEIHRQKTNGGIVARLERVLNENALLIAEQRAMLAEAEVS